VLHTLQVLLLCGLFKDQHSSQQCEQPRQFLCHHIVHVPCHVLRTLQVLLLCGLLKDQHSSQQWSSSSVCGGMQARLAWPTVYYAADCHVLCTFQVLLLCGLLKD
jgi:uncharacterized protein YhhL (DUF1145 family)